MDEFGKTYIDYFSEIYARFIEKTEKRLENYRINGLPKNVGFYYKLLRNGFMDIAIGEIILNKDIVKSKQYFYLVAKMQEVIFQKYDDKFDISMDYVNTNSYGTLFMALISDNKDLINSLSALFGGRDKEEADDDILGKLVGYSVKHIILKEFDEAETYVIKLQELNQKSRMRLYKGYGIVLDGIIKKNKESVQEGLVYMLECHRKLTDDYGDTPEELLSIPALGLAKLAMNNGIEVEVDHILAPKVMLEQRDIQYPIVDFVD
ncbi:Imm49 family immunity protein [Paenibacillus glacialis]|uniref:Uncharacterized protein n=1 Tax=Paenibacillus glacialis TaxID=494026 RepID=A0A162KEU9_9BACL|nr:Imm49 family immunity protein [Paenibacillus glacialis]OAB45508.1 hypothetical protein PGLA_04455 [Paenibacillus glacialis]